MPLLGFAPQGQPEGWERASTASPQEQLFVAALGFTYNYEAIEQKDKDCEFKLIPKGLGELGFQIQLYASA